MVMTVDCQHLKSASSQFIMDRLYDELSKIDRFEEVLADIVNTAAKRFEQGWYMTPKEKHMLLKVCDARNARL